MADKKISENRQNRTDEIERIRGLFNEVEGGVLTDFRGLKVKEITDLRRRFIAKGIDYQVVKNTLTRIAVEETNYKDLHSVLRGPTGIAFCKENPMAAAQVIVEFSKDHDKLEVKGGFMEGTVLSIADVVEISKISSKDDLKSQLLSVVNGPSQKFLGTINAVPQKFLGVLKAQAEKLEGS